MACKTALLCKARNDAHHFAAPSAIDFVMAGFILHGGGYCGRLAPVEKAALDAHRVAQERGWIKLLPSLPFSGPLKPQVWVLTKAGSLEALAAKTRLDAIRKAQEPAAITRRKPRTSPKPHKVSAAAPSLSL